MEIFSKKGSALMENESGFSPAVMEGGGAYNRHATLQAAGARLAIPFFEKAVRDVTLDPVDLPVVIADYGSSQGKNSLAPIRIAIGNLRPRLGRIAPSPSFTSINLPTTSTRSSKCWTWIRTAMRWTTPTYFPVRSADRSMRMFFPLIQSIWVGARMRPCGSAASPP
jgi:hypothetical protein